MNYQTKTHMKQEGVLLLLRMRISAYLALALFLSPLLTNAQSATVTPIAIEDCNAVSQNYSVTYGSYQIYQVDATFSPSGSGSLTDNGSGSFTISWTSPGTATIDFAYYDGGSVQSFTGIKPTTTYSHDGQPGTLSVSSSSVEYGSDITLSNSGGKGFIYQKCTGASCPTNSDTNWSTTTSSQTNLQTTTKYRTKSTACGVEYSAIKTVTVYPEFLAGSISGPSNACPGDINFTSMEATGGNGTIHYQWEFSTDQSTWYDVNWATADEANLQNVSTTSTYRYYRRKAWSDFDENLHSNTINLDDLGILNPLNAGSLYSQTICYNTTPATIQGAGASGGGGNYQYSWQFSSDNSTWSTPVSTGTNPEFSDLAGMVGNITSDHYVRRTVTSYCGGPSQSTETTITVSSAKSAGTLVTNTNPEYNSNITLSVSGNTGSVTYEQSSNGTSWTSVSSSVNGITSDTYFRTKLLDTSCGDKYSPSVFVDVYPEFSAGSISAPANPCPGYINFTSVAASGGNGSPGYQWEFSTDGSTWYDVNWNTADEANLQNVPTGGQYRYYRRKAWSAFNEDLYSNTINLDNLGTLDALGAGSLYSQTICYNSTPSTIQGTSATGGGGNYQYSWRFSSDNSSWSAPVSTGSSSDFADVVNTIGNLTADYYVRRIVTSQCGGSSQSTDMTITVSPATSAGALSTTTDPEYNSSITLSVSGNTGSVSYEKSSNGTSWSPTTSVVSGITSDTYFRAKLDDTSCGTKYTASVFVDVYPEFSTGSISLPSTSCPAVTLSITGVAATGGKGTPSYQWEQSDNGTSWTPVSSPSAGNNTLDGVSIDATARHYRRKAWSLFGENEYSNVVDLDDISVISGLDPGTLNAQKICAGSSANHVTGTPASGSTGSYTYTWQFSNDGSSWGTPVAGGETFTDIANHLNNLTSSTYVRRNVSSGCSMTAHADALITVLPASTPICQLNGESPLIYPAPTDLLLDTVDEVVLRWDYFPELLGSDIYYEQGGQMTLIAGDLPINATGGEVSYTWNFANPVVGEFELVVIDKSGLVTFRSDQLEFVEPLAITSLIGGKSEQWLNKPLDIEWVGGSENWTFDLEIFEVGNGIPILGEYGVSYRSYFEELAGLDTATDYNIVLAQNNLQLTVPMTVVECKSIFASNDQNYVITHVSRQELTNCLAIKDDPDAVNQSIQYIDGLGRLDQTIVRNGAVNINRDLITSVSYDAFGRQTKTWLPMVANTDGAYLSDFEVQQQAYYQTIYPADKDFAFSENILESGPAHRVLETAAPGATWSKGNGHTVENKFNVNAANEVKVLSVENGNIQTSGGYYAQGLLFKTTVSDENTAENEGQSVEYTDKSGKVLLRKTKLSESAGVTTFAQTYYIYDEFDQLRHVVQPEGVRLIEEETGYSWTSLTEDTFQKRWVFSYQYDERQRQKAKRVPGSDWVYFIYDSRDRLVLTQDGKSRITEELAADKSLTQYEGKSYAVGSNKLMLSTNFHFKASATNGFKAKAGASVSFDEWTLTKYDAFNRPVLTGRVALAESPDTVRQLLHDHYQSGGYYSEEYNGGPLEGYSNDAFPQVATEDLLTVTYYDNYSFTNESVPAGALAQPKGQVTGTKTRVLGSGTWLTSIIFYDDRYRVVKTITDNHQGGKDIVDFTYRNTISPLVKQTTTTHTGTASVTVVETHTYDHLDRLVSTVQTINGGSPTTLFVNNFNDRGELTEKNLGVAGATSAQSVDYDYNIRGWLTNINGGHGTFDDPATDQFGLELVYASDNQYNGNIDRLRWRNAGTSSNEKQEYVLEYDASNRLSRAVYKNGTNATKNGYFNVHGLAAEASGEGIVYDHNGNIRELRRNGNGAIDGLTYDYQGNQLDNVGDAYGAVGFDDVGSPGSIAGEYQYDANGNMIADANKGINEIRYNYFNLPELVKFTDGREVEYRYDATGIKLTKTFTNGGAVKISDYVGGMHYEQEPGESAPALEFVQHAEGRVLYTGSGWDYQYHLTDHLGNVRTTVDASGGVVQADDYYPFGGSFNHYNLSIQGSGENLYKYNGKEEQKETEWYDYGARMYDPWIGRWNHVDPLADAYDFFTVYGYVLNNPLKFVDPDGRKVLYVNGYWQDTWLGKNIIGSHRSGRMYWSADFVGAASDFFNDGRRGNGMFIDGSTIFGGDESGSERYSRGYEYAREHYDELLADMAEDETFKLVTHSEGGAFGAGIAQYLIDQGQTVETIVHLSTDEGDEFETPEEPNTYQLGYGGDWVTGNKAVKGADVFGVVNKFSEAKDRFLYSHGSTKGGRAFRDLEALLKAAASGATGVNVTESDSGISFKFIRKEDEEKEE